MRNSRLSTLNTGNPGILSHQSKLAGIWPQSVPPSLCPWRSELTYERDRHKSPRQEELQGSLCKQSQQLLEPPVGSVPLGGLPHARSSAKCWFIAPSGGSSGNCRAVCLKLGGAGHYWKPNYPSTTQKRKQTQRSGFRVGADSKLEPECPLYNVAFHGGSPNILHRLGCTQLPECLPSMHECLGSVPRTA